MKKILMANDLSERSELALARAALLAEAFGSGLEILSVVPKTSHEETTRDKVAAARQAIAYQMSQASIADRPSVAAHVTPGHDFEDIIARSEALGSDLVVLGNHRHKLREMFVGTTAERVIRHGKKPVLVVKTTAAGPYRRVLIATDLSPHSEAAADLAARLVPSGEIVLLHAVSKPFRGFLDESSQTSIVEGEIAAAEERLRKTSNRIKAECGEAAPEIDIRVMAGDLDSVIAAQIEALKPDLLVIGTHGRTGIAHALIGSAAEELLSSCPIDIAVVKAA
ncbi:MAG: universal stress protein [Pseudomonadota bacterium]